jgi:dihydroceramidase
VIVNETDHRRNSDPMQLVDELSMIYTTCLMCYASFSYSRSNNYRIVLSIFLTALAVFITLYYHYLQNPVFHQNAYALLTAIVLIRSMYTMEMKLRPSLRHSTEEDRLEREKKGLPVLSKEQQHYENERDLKTLKTMWLMVGIWTITSVARYGGGGERLAFPGEFCWKGMDGGKLSSV